MSSSKSIIDSLASLAKQNKEQVELIRDLHGIAQRYPILLALNKWLRKINSGIKIPDDVKEQNNKIFAAFVFLLNNDYLFYLTITAQTELIKKFFASNQKKIPIEVEDLLAKIRMQYEQALENNTLVKLQASSTQKRSSDTNLNSTYFIPPAQSFEIYRYVERECQLLKYEYKKEQIKVFREVFNEEATALMDEVESNPDLPQDIKDEVKEDLRRYLDEFEDELIDAEEILEAHPLKDVLHTITPEMYSKIAKGLPTIPQFEFAPDEFEDIDDFEIDEELASDLSIHPIDEERAQSRSRSSSDVVQSSSRGSSGVGEELASNLTIHPIDEERAQSRSRSISGASPELPQRRSRVSPAQDFYPNPEVAEVALLHQVSRLREKWESVSKAFLNPETGRLRHDSLHSTYMRHRKSITRLDEMLEHLSRKYQPAIDHLEQEVSRAQQIAVDDLKVDLHRFANLLSQAKPVSVENQNRVNDYISSLSNLVVKLDNLSDSQSIQEALLEQLKELEGIDELFQGELKGLAPQYQQLKEQLRQKANLKLPESGIILNSDTPVTEQSEPPKPTYRKFASHLAAFHEQQRIFHPKKLPSIVGEYHATKEPRAKDPSQSDLNSDMEVRLKNFTKTIQMFLTRCITAAKNEGSNTSSLEAITNTLAKIKEAQFKSVDLNDLTKLAEQLEAQPSGLSIHSYASGCRELEKNIRESSINATHTM